MTIAYLCVLIAIFIPLICVGYAKFGVRGYNNRNPREFLEGLDGKFKRANYAQINSYESFAPFASGVIIAHQTGAIQSQVDMLAFAYLILRMAYCVCYVKDWATQRSLSWFMAFGCTIGLFVISF